MIFATHSTHKLLAGISQASQIIVQDSRDAEARPPHLQRGVPDAHVDVAAVRDHRVVRRVGGDDGAARAAPRWSRSRSSRRSTSAARCARSTTSGARTGGSRSGARSASRPRAWASATTGCCAPTRSGTASATSRRASTSSTRSRRRSSRPGLDVSGKFAKTGIPASIVTKYLAEHGVIVEKTGLYSFFIMFTIGITKGRWNTLVTALQQFKDDYDKNQPLWRILPEFVREAAEVRARRPARPVPADPRHVQGQRRRARDDRDVPVGHAAGDEAVRRVRVHGASRDRPRRDRRPRGPRDERAADALSAGHSAADSRASASTGRSSSTCKFARSFNEQFPGFDTDIHGLVEETDGSGKVALLHGLRAEEVGRCLSSGVGVAARASGLSTHAPGTPCSPHAQPRRRALRTSDASHMAFHFRRLLPFLDWPRFTREIAARRSCRGHHRCAGRRSAIARVRAARRRPAAVRALRVGHSGDPGRALRFLAAARHRARRDDVAADRGQRRRAGAGRNRSVLRVRDAAGAAVGTVPAGLRRLRAPGCC